MAFYILGPLLFHDNKRGAYILLGTVSFGYKCAYPGKPGYYARVNQVLPWIRYTIENQGTSTCPEDELKGAYDDLDIISVGSNSSAIQLSTTIVACPLQYFHILSILSEHYR